MDVREFLVTDGKVGYWTVFDGQCYVATAKKCHHAQAICRLHLEHLVRQALRGAA